MNAIGDEMQFFKPLLKMIASQWGESCEVVLHDWSQGYDKTIVYIENGHVTGRKVGDCGSNLGLEVMRGTVQEGDRYNYVTQTETGKTLKSSTMFIKNSSGKAIGALCINVDISSLIMAKKALGDLVGTGKNEVSEYFASNVHDLLGFLIKESINKVGKPVKSMTKEDKMEMLGFLDEKGAFLISKSGAKICKVMDISKYTLYNYLDEIHNSNNKSISYPEFE